MPGSITPAKRIPGPGNDNLSGSAHTGDSDYGQARQAKCDDEYWRETLGSGIGADSNALCLFGHLAHDDFGPIYR